MTAGLRRIARGVFADYRLNWVLRAPAGGAAAALPDGVTVRRPLPRDRAWAAGCADAAFRDGLLDPTADSFVLVERGEPRCVARFVGPAGYRDAAIWPLPPDARALTGIDTRIGDRGRGLAPLLIAAATPLALEDAAPMAPAGATPMAPQAATGAICFIWWSHRASLRAFRRAGWRRIGFSAEVTTRGGRVWRWRGPRRG